jgi:hypothetical protein
MSAGLAKPRSAPASAQAVSLGHTIVTDNEPEFAPIDSLPQENWLRYT